MQIIGNFINGRTMLSNSGEFLPVINPAKDGIIRKVTQSAYDEMQLVITSTYQVFPSWAAISSLCRAWFLFKFTVLIENNRQALAIFISYEHGKMISDVLGELARKIDVVVFACEIPHLIKGEYSANVGSGVDCFSIMQPVDIVAEITPFNILIMVFPIAFACGNSFVQKRSSTVLSTSLHIAELLNEAGLPDNILNVIHCDNDITSLLTCDPQIKTVSFVGSFSVTEYIYKTAGAHGKRVQTFGVVKNHAIVMLDADIDATMNPIKGSTFGSVSERCMVLPLVVAVGNDIAKKLIRKLTSSITSLCIGVSNNNLQGKENEMEPVYSLSHQQKIVNFIDKGVTERTELVVGKQNYQVDSYPNGFYVSGTLFDNVTNDMKIYKENIFKPVLGIVQQISTTHYRLSMDMHLTIAVLFSHQTIILLVNLCKRLKLE